MCSTTLMLCTCTHRGMSLFSLMCIIMLVYVLIHSYDHIKGANIQANMIRETANIKRAHAQRINWSYWQKSKILRYVRHDKYAAPWHQQTERSYPRNKVAHTGIGKWREFAVDMRNTRARHIIHGTSTLPHLKPNAKNNSLLNLFAYETVATYIFYASWSLV